MSSEALAFPRPADWLELTKPRITLLVTLTTAAGFALASERPLDWPRFVATLIGTALVAAGSAAWNQFVERETDKLMRRTATRPLPGGRMLPAQALAFGGLLSVSGLLVLSLLVNPLTAAIGLATLLAYVLVYTPMKRRSTPSPALQGRSISVAGSSSPSSFSGSCRTSCRSPGSTATTTGARGCRS